MNIEPMVTIPLSDYNQLIRERDNKAQANMTVGRQYILNYDGKEETWYCQSFDPTGFHFVGDRNGTRTRLSIKLKR